MATRKDATMEQDRRGLRLSWGSAILTLLVFILALATATSTHWATRGQDTHFGPWKACQGNFCSSTVGGSSVLKTTWASLVAGICSVTCTILLGVATFLSPIIIMMHSTQTKVFIKFRHATLAKMVCTAAAAFCSVISLVCWVLEALVFVASSGSYVSFGWGFYTQIFVVIIGWGVGALSSLEWTKSRKLGGDPTVYGRDPEGKNAITISNPNVADSLENGTKPTNGHLIAGTSSRSSGRSSHRNTNGVAMTRTSGQPYMIQPNGHTNGRSSGRGQNGSRPHQYDPKAIPLRSSLRRKPKPEAPTSGEDTTDTSTGIPNPAFQPGSPTLKKKTVRIHTQSTAV